MLRLLIKKDLMLIQKTTALFVICICIFSAIASLKSNPTTIYVILIQLFIYMIYMNVEARNSKNNSELLMHSLPVDRNVIMIGKFINIIIYFCISTIIVYLSSKILSLFIHIQPLTSLDMNGIVLAFLITSIYYLIYIPIQSKYGYNKLQAYNAALYFVLFLAVSLVMKVDGNLAGMSHLILHDKHSIYLIIGTFLIALFVIGSSIVHRK